MLKPLPVRRVFRHFPVVSKHPRARVLAHAAEAAALQGSFWEMHDSLLEDQGHLDDPHLWERARALGLDLDRFESDLTSPYVVARVRDDMLDAEAMDITATPTLFINGRRHTGPHDARSLIDALTRTATVVAEPDRA